MYCCVGALALSGDLYRVDADQLGWWLCERQLPSGGLNGEEGEEEIEGEDFPMGKLICWNRGTEREDREKSGKR